eukprot:7103734-Prymnesium_polylepis.1
MAPLRALLRASRGQKRASAAETHGGPASLELLNNGDGESCSAPALYERDMMPPEIAAALAARAALFGDEPRTVTMPIVLRRPSVEASSYLRLAEFTANSPM